MSPPSPSWAVERSFALCAALSVGLAAVAIVVVVGRDAFDVVGVFAVLYVVALLELLS